jgi:hypothetical protein
MRGFASFLLDQVVHQAVNKRPKPPMQCNAMQCNAMQCNAMLDIPFMQVGRYITCTKETTKVSLTFLYVDTLIFSVPNGTFLHVVILQK